jgi:c-di-GMP-binding flagellar brake protein YcgR
MSPELRERRKFRRYDFPSPMEYGLNLEVADEVFRAYTINISGNGMCSYLEGPVKLGQEVTIKECVLPFLCGAAIVRWVNKLDKNTYMAGLECLTHAGLAHRHPVS